MSPKTTKLKMLVLVFMLLLTGPALAASLGDSADPIDVKADSTEFDGGKNLVTFTGNVTARRGPMTINSETLEVKLNPGTREINEITATGKVSVRREDILATGQKAVYDIAADTVTLTGAPKIWRGTDAVEGETVLIHLKDERLIVKGGAHVILNPQKKGGQTGKGQ